MKLWLLRPVNAWEPWYDKVFGFVVRAECENTARLIAKEHHCDEGDWVWLGPEVTTCVELTTNGPQGVILRDKRAA